MKKESIDGATQAKPTHGKDQRTAVVVEDSPDTRLLVERILKSLDLKPISFDQVQPALQYLSSQPKPFPTMLITDLSLPDADGLELVRKIKGESPQLPTVVMTAYASVSNAVEALRLRVDEFIEKPFNVDAFQSLLGRFLDPALAPPVISVPRGGSHDHLLIGHSQVMKNLYHSLGTVAQSNANILLSGETGTGKELVARVIHRLSPRQKGPFVAVNCGAIPEGLFESELFGHTRGAFTGAIERRTGLFEEADGGTLFLDEIGELSLHMQVKLLRVLQDQCVRPVGANTARSVDVRIVAATNKDLKQEVASKKFRTDLYYRINILSLGLPPLRHRSQDIPLLSYHFLERFRRRYKLRVDGFSSESLKKLMTYKWPGNIRELENVIERAVVFSRQGTIPAENILIDDDLNSHSGQRPQVHELPELRRLEREYIDYVLTHTSGRKEEASRILGIDRKTLHRKRQKSQDVDLDLAIDFHRLFQKR